MASQTSQTKNVYETDESLHMYLGLHYPNSGNSEGVDPILAHANAPQHCLRFPQRVAALLSSLKPVRTTNKALDMGCAVGGSSFELAKIFDQVDAFDFSESFVSAAKQMKAGDTMRFKIPIEAELFEEVEVCHEDGVDEVVRSKVNFFTGDACNLSGMQAEGKLGTYDGVIMSNLLCRLPDPMACLNDLNGIMNKGGVVVMVTPFSWLIEFTPRDKWLGGFYDSESNEKVRSKDVLQKVMEKNGFEKIHEDQMPLIIREHQRKYQYIISETTAWRKTD
jgi:putative 4-mercaptohistidine N1-methyltranferase